MEEAEEEKEAKEENDILSACLFSAGNWCDSRGLVATHQRRCRRREETMEIAEARIDMLILHRRIRSNLLRPKRYNRW